MECDAARADLPVIDPTGLVEWAQQVANEIKAYALQLEAYVVQAKAWATQNLQWVLQGQQYAMQAQQYLLEGEQLLAFVHNPNLGAALGLLNKAGLGNTLPPVYGVLGIVNGFQYGQGGLPEITGILSALSGLVSSSFATNHVYTPTDQTWSSQQLIARANGIAGEQGTAQTTYQDLHEHAALLPALRAQLLTATNPKDVADAAAQIAVEQTWTANEAAQMAAVQATYQAQSDAVIQRDNEKLKMDFTNFINSVPAG
jgi:hypothetical protein